MERLFLLNGAIRHNPAVSAWLGARDDPPARLARAWYAHVRACGEDVGDVLHDRQATACIGQAAFAWVAPFRAHASIGFFNGVALADPAGLLEGTGKWMRHVKLRPGVTIDADAVRALIAAAYHDMRRQLGAGAR